MSVSAFLNPDPVIVTYRGSPIQFTLTLTENGVTITNLASYSQIDFHVRSGSREEPGPIVLNLKLTGSAPLYLSVNGSNQLVVNVPVSASTALAAGQYYAELWVTPPAAERKFVGWVLWNHEQTSIGVS